MHLHALLLQTEAVIEHTVKGRTNNLGSMSTLIRNAYITIFKDDTMSIYDAQNTTITVSKATILEGWYVSHEIF